MTNSTIEDKKDEFEGESSIESTSRIDGASSYPNIPIKISSQQFSCYELKRGYEIKKNMELDPDFQRNDALWGKKQKSELIESILMGIPIPIIYFFENDAGKKQIVDGRQRLSCIFNYLNNEFALSELDKLMDLNGKCFKDLSPQLQSKIEDYQFTVYTIQPPTPELVKFDIFDRVNRGGTKLNNQEMRNALYLGKATTLLKELAASEQFLLATGNGISQTRMKDTYLILRYLGFYLLRNNKLIIQDKVTKQDIVREYKSDMDELLAEVMKYINKLPDNEIINLKNVFVLAMSNCYNILGNDAFRFNRSGNKRPINMGLFESLGYLFSINIPNNINKELIKTRILELKEEMDGSGKFTGIIDSNVGVKYRFDQADKVRGELFHA